MVGELRPGCRVNLFWFIAPHRPAVLVYIAALSVWLAGGAVGGGLDNRSCEWRCQPCGGRCGLSVGYNAVTQMKQWHVV